MKDYRLKPVGSSKEVVSYGLKSCAPNKRKHATFFKRLPIKKKDHQRGHRKKDALKNLCALWLHFLPLDFFVVTKPLPPQEKPKGFA